MKLFNLPNPMNQWRLFVLLFGLFILSNAQLFAQVVTATCTNSYNLCTGDAIKLEPNVPGSYTNYKWYANTVTTANEITSTTAASFFVNAALSTFPSIIVTTKPISGTSSSIKYILTAEYPGPPTGCATIVNEVTVNFMPTPVLSATAITICTPSPGSQSINLATLVTDANATVGTLTFYATMANATAGTSPIASTVNPTGTTTYYARKTTTATDLNTEGCFAVIPVTVTVQCLSLGNQVWYDTNNNGTKDAGEAPIPMVTVNLYYDANGDGSLTGAEQTPLSTTQTDATGLYLFENLKEGKYFVGIPSSEFGAGETLNSLYSSGTTRNTAGVISETTAPDPDLVATDSDDNGTAQTTGFFAGGILSSHIDLNYASEPTGETPDNSTNPADNNDNLTVDFGFYGMSIGSQLFTDTNNSGTRDGAETGIAGVTVKLYAADGTTLIATTTTGTDGRYLFTNLPAGNYIVAVDATSTALTGKQSSDDIASSGTPNTADNDDNGTVTSTVGEIRSTVFSLTPGAAPTGESDETQAASTGAGLGATAVKNNALTPDANSNLQVDFGFKPVCPTITVPAGAQTICAGDDGVDITVNTNQNNANSIRFVRFTTAQTGNAMYTGGTNIGTSVTPTGSADPYTATYPFATADFPNTTNAPITYYVYAVLTPTPSDPTCRPFQEIQIIVNPTPTVNDPTDQTVCNGLSTSLVTFASTFNVTGTTYDWTNNTTSIGLGAAGTGNIAAFTATNTTASPITATITVTPKANGCLGTPQTFTITVNPQPVFTLSLPPVCAGTNPEVQITLGTGAPANPNVAVDGGTAFAYSTLSGGLLTTANGITVPTSGTQANAVTLTNTATGCTYTQNVPVPAMVQMICVPVKVTKL
jgi:SdrD B-like domain/PKD-like domain